MDKVYVVCVYERDDSVNTILAVFDDIDKANAYCIALMKEDEEDFGDCNLSYYVIEKEVY